MLFLLKEYTRTPYPPPRKTVCRSRSKLEPDMEQQTGSKLVKEYFKVSPSLFDLYAEYIMQNVRLDEGQTEIKIAGRNINNLRYAYDTIFMAESEEELKSLLMKVKKESDCWLKTQHSENEDQFSSVQSLSRAQLFATP